MIFSLDYEFNVVRRFNRERVCLCSVSRSVAPIRWLLSVICEEEVQEKIQVPEGYKMTYFGEQSEQDKGNKRSPLISR